MSTEPSEIDNVPAVLAPDAPPTMMLEAFPAWKPHAAPSVSTSPEQTIVAAASVDPRLTPMMAPTIAAAILVVRAHRNG